MTGTSYTTPTSNLKDIKKALSSVKTLRMTGSSRFDATNLGLDDQDIVDAIQNIQDLDFYKSMPSYNSTFPYQDVYKFNWRSLYIYAKFQNVNGYFVLSFKRSSK